jgi:phosphate acetyltransferase
LDIIEASKSAIRGRRLRVALPEPEDERILHAAQRLAAAQLARPVLIGRVADVGAHAAAAGIALDGCEVCDPSSDARLTIYAAHITAGREKMTAGMAERMLRRPLYFAGAMTAVGDSAAMVAGVANPTKRVIEAGLMTIGLAPGITTPSSFFLMMVPAKGGRHRPYIFADCAINADPSPPELAAIAVASADSARSLLREEPRVALLSFSTHGSAAHPRVDKVLAALAVAKGLRPDLAIEGELQGDAAVSPTVAAKKVRDKSAVAGRANVLVFPDLDAGNITYKLVQHLGGATAIGPFLQGFAKPISDLSRGASVDDIVATVAVTLARSMA